MTAYGESYGPLPEIWFTTAHGTVDEQALTRYRKTGTVVAEWDCAPAPGDDDLSPTRASTAAGQCTSSAGALWAGTKPRRTSATR